MGGESSSGGGCSLGSRSIVSAVEMRLATFSLAHRRREKRGQGRGDRRENLDGLGTENEPSATSSLSSLSSSIILRSFSSRAERDSRVVVDVDGPLEGGAGSRSSSSCSDSEASFMGSAKAFVSWRSRSLKPVGLENAYRLPALLGSPVHAVSNTILDQRFSN